MSILLGLFREAILAPMMDMLLLTEAGDDLTTEDGDSITFED